MIYGIGIDLIEIDRVRKAMEKTPRFASKVFTEREIASFTNGEKVRYESAAGLFACKEAVSKALGTGISKFKWTDIEILKEENGAPKCLLHGKAEEIAGEKGINRVHISISHDKNNAVANCIMEMD